MARVYYIPEKDLWVHADTGNKIGGWDVRNQEPHASEIKKRAGKATIPTKNIERVAGPLSPPGSVNDPGGEAPVPASNDFTKAEESYVEEILREGNYA